jgi:hypothetical protein
MAKQNYRYYKYRHYETEVGNPDLKKIAICKDNLRQLCSDELSKFRQLDIYKFRRNFLSLLDKNYTQNFPSILKY